MESLNKIIDSRIPVVIEVATVLSVSLDTCKVKSLTTGKIHFKCALNAIFKNDSEFIKFEPEVDSNVIIVIANEKAFVIQFSKVKSFTFKYKEMVFNVDENGFAIENKGENLGDLISKFITEIKTAVIVTPSGPGSFSPTAVTKLEGLDLKFKKILKTI